MKNAHLHLIQVATDWEERLIQGLINVLCLTAFLYDARRECKYYSVGAKSSVVFRRYTLKGWLALTWLGLLFDQCPELSPIYGIELHVLTVAS